MTAPSVGPSSWVGVKVQEVETGQTAELSITATAAFGGSLVAADHGCLLDQARLGARSKA